MKNLITIVVVALMTLSFAAAYEPNYVIDGDLSDWQLNPFSDGTFHLEDFTPNDADVDYVLGDWPTNGISPVGGEIFDLEALYFDDHDGYAYFAIVTSLPPEGRSGYVTGDLGIDLDNDPMTGEGGFEFGIKMLGPDAGKVCYMPDWHENVDGYGYRDQQTYLTCPNGYSGSAEIAYNKDYYNGDNGEDTYVIEIKVHKSLLNWPEYKDISSAHISQTCGNDVLELGDFDWDYVPEFSVLAASLVLIGAGLFIYKRRN